MVDASQTAGEMSGGGGYFGMRPRKYPKLQGEMYEADTKEYFGMRPR